jgi:hypothetical protein
MSKLDQEIIRAALYETIRNQINTNSPPETKKTYKRLLALGYSEEETMSLIEPIVFNQMFEVLHEGRPYNETAYEKALRNLPRLPDDETNQS